MLLNSHSFLLVFLPLVVALYWLTPHGRPRLVLLVGASLFFYGLWDWRYVPLLLTTTLVDWVAGRLLAGSTAEGASRRRKLVLAAALALNLAVLGYFKYRGFFVDQLDGILHLLGMGRPLPTIRFILPVGISFYTFAGISYAVDMYRGQYPPARSMLHYLAWVTLFPYVLAGPIIRYGHVGAQLESVPRRLSWALVASGLFFLVLGLAKKMLVADVMAPYVNELFAHPGRLGLWSAWAAALGYTLQLYFDFSGYSDMAVGVALLIGLRFPQNFDSPYKAVNPSDFWRRWHMSLSAWLRDYLFIPLGGSRGSTLLTVRNLLITFVLAGLWHGAAWTFVAISFFETINGGTSLITLSLVQLISRLLSKHFFTKSLHKSSNSIPTIRPMPRMSLTFCKSNINSRFLIRYSPIFFALSINFSDSIVFITVNPTEVARGFPPKVVP